MFLETILVFAISMTFFSIAYPFMDRLSTRIAQLTGKALQKIGESPHLGTIAFCFGTLVIVVGFQVLVRKSSSLLCPFSVLSALKPILYTFNTTAFLITEATFAALAIVGIAVMASKIKKLSAYCAVLVIIVVQGLVFWQALTEKQPLVGTSTFAMSETLSAFDGSELKVVPLVDRSELANDSLLRKFVQTSGEPVYYWDSPPQPQWADGQLALHAVVKRYYPGGSAGEVAVDSERVSIRGANARLFLTDLRQTFASSLPFRPRDTAFQVTLPKDPYALQNLLSGLDGLYSYSEEGLSHSSLMLDSTIHKDSCFFAAYLYKAYSLCMQVDRGWSSTETTIEVDPMLLVDSANFYVAKAIGPRKTLCDTPESGLKNGDIFLLKRTRGLISQVYGDLYRRASVQVEGLDRRRNLTIARTFYEESAARYIEALRRQLTGYLVENNLSKVYYSMAEIAFDLADTADGRRYLLAAIKTIDYAIIKDPIQSHYLVNKGLYEFSYYKHLGGDSARLISADSLLLEAYNGSRASPWFGYCAYNLACTRAVLGKIAESSNFLREAVHANSFNVLRVALNDPDLQPLRARLSKEDFENLLKGISPEDVS
jgi:tetratricopeptide (TPR) repeat protein